jgi:hypothetical protein
MPDFDYPKDYVLDSEEIAERKLWDNTLLDGLENDYYNPKRLPISIGNYDTASDYAETITRMFLFAVKEGTLPKVGETEPYLPGLIITVGENNLDVQIVFPEHTDQSIVEIWNKYLGKE